MINNCRVALAFTLIGLLTLPLFSAGDLLDRDAQRLAKARENHRTEINRAFDVYARRVEQANTILSRVYDQTIKQYEARGDTAAVSMLRAELEELIGHSMTIAFPSDDEIEEVGDAPFIENAYEQLIEAIGPIVVHSSGSRSPSANAVNYDYLVLYYTASWCGPCRRFTPEFIRFYQRHHNRKSKWEILVVSGDRTVEAFENYVVSAKMPWHVVPFERSEAMHELYRGGYPRVHVVNREGQVVLRSRLAQQTYDEFFAELRDVVSQ